LTKRERKPKGYYESFILAGIGKEAPWDDLRGRYILDKNSFVEKIKAYLDRRKRTKETPRIERFATRPQLSQIFSRIRDKKELI